MVLTSFSSGIVEISKLREAFAPHLSKLGMEFNMGNSYVNYVQNINRRSELAPPTTEAEGMVSYQANFLASLAAAVEGETEASLLRRANAGDGEAMLLLADCYQFEARAVVGNSNRQHNVMNHGKWAYEACGANDNAAAGRALVARAYMMDAIITQGNGTGRAPAPIEVVNMLDMAAELGYTAPISLAFPSMGKYQRHFDPKQHIWLAQAITVNEEEHSQYQCKREEQFHRKCSGPGCTVRASSKSLLKACSTYRIVTNDHRNRRNRHNRHNHCHICGC
mmetsp:Transcript_76793/g.220565  ORF Transcript_76793/g.220565 Transcript_76793/m.220565 type:complete len:279 (-) Transcript_76793:255-1091(-)